MPPGQPDQQEQKRQADIGAFFRVIALEHVDFNQNAPHKTVFGAWFARPRTGGQVSTPLTWDEVETVVPDSLTIRSVPDLVAERGDPWADIATSPQSIEPLLDMAARDKEAGLHDAPWPPQYPKMPDEPPRVAPSRAKKTDETA